jgi:hypothetical protein
LKVTPILQEDQIELEDIFVRNYPSYRRIINEVFKGPIEMHVTFI